MKQEKDHEAGGHTDLAERRRLKMRRCLKQTVCLLLALLLTAGTLPASVLAYSDPREQAHGISYIQTPSGRYLIWSDQYGRKSANGSWTHDIYALPVTKAGLRNPEANKQTLVSAHEAQEPASASVAGDGSVFLTFEDGNATTYRGHDYTLAQRYAIFSSSLRPEVPYDPQKTTVKWGGHSGHSASTKKHHIVFYSEGWVDGGADHGLGTGDDVWISSFSANGRGKRTTKVSVGKKHRDWWPMIAASESKAFLVWQRYVPRARDAQLCCAVYDPSTGRKGRTRILKRRTAYYCYQVQYAAPIKRFVLTLTDRKGKGACYLFDNKGNVTAKKTGLPGFVREASPAVINGSASVRLCYPRAKGGAAYLRVTGNSVRYLGVRTRGRYIDTGKAARNWSIRGTAGFYDRTARTVCFATLGKTRLRVAVFPAAL